MLNLPESIAKRIGLFGLAVLFPGMGALHFASTDSFIATMPAYLPLQLELVYLSGMFEIAFGIGVLVPRLRRHAGYGLVLLLIAVFPANVNMALHPDQFLADGVSPAALYGRLPFQLLLIYWAIWATRPDPVESLDRMCW